MTGRSIAIAAASAALLVASGGAACGGETHEFWPELQFHKWFDERRSRAIFMMSHNRDRDSNSTYQAEVGLTFEHHFTSWFWGRIGYRHGNSTDGGPFQENRLLAEQIFRMPLGFGFSADFRTREDFRWLNTGFFVRLRERIQVQRDITIGNYFFTPYASAEVIRLRPEPRLRLPRRPHGPQASAPSWASAPAIRLGGARTHLRVVPACRPPRPPRGDRLLARGQAPPWPSVAPAIARRTCSSITRTRPRLRGARRLPRPPASASTSPRRRKKRAALAPRPILVRLEVPTVRSTSRLAGCAGCRRWPPAWTGYSCRSFPSASW